MSNIGKVLLALAVMMTALPVLSCEAQKLKLPDFFPFRKKTQEIRPIKLSDQAAQRVGGPAGEDKGILDFLKPSPQAGQARSLTEANDNSRSFFQKTGDELGDFASDTRKFFSDAWNPPRARKAWWNQNQQPDKAEKPSLFAWPGTRPPATQQAPPMPRTARQFQQGKPKHRF
jgi:hypothetical protein